MPRLLGQTDAPSFFGAGGRLTGFLFDENFPRRLTFTPSLPVTLSAVFLNSTFDMQPINTIVQSTEAIPFQPAAAVFGRDPFEFLSQRFRSITGWIEFPSSFSAGETQHGGRVIEFVLDQVSIFPFHC